MTRDEVMFYAGKYGPEQASFILVLCGPDDFRGTYEEYESLLKELETRA